MTECVLLAQWKVPRKGPFPGSAISDFISKFLPCKSGTEVRVYEGDQKVLSRDKWTHNSRSSLWTWLKNYSIHYIVHICAAAAAAAAKSLQSCPTLCYAIDCSPPGSAVPGILQARTLGGLSFPSPMHESEKWKASHSVVFDSSCPHGLQPTRLLCPWDFPGKSTGARCHCLLRQYVLYNIYHTVYTIQYISHNIYYTVYTIYVIKAFQGWVLLHAIQCNCDQTGFYI